MAEPGLHVVVSTIRSGESFRRPSSKETLGNGVLEPFEAGKAVFGVRRQ